MENKKLTVLIIQIIMFTMVLLLFTAGAGDKIVKARLTMGGFFLVLGIILLTFKGTIAKSMYEKQIEAIKKKSSVEKLTKGMNHGGILLSSVGIIVVLVGLIFQ